MLKRIQRCLWIAVPMLAMTYGALALPVEKQKDSSSNPKQSNDKQKGAKNSGYKDADQPVDPSQYVGSETCKTCHEEVAAGYEKGPHWKTTLVKLQGPEWQGCEACHGPGKAHAESADPEKIIRFGGLSREESSKRCLSCHEFGQEHANFLRSEHVKNNVGCIDCHSVHTPRVQARLLTATMPQLCYSCHLEVKPDFSKPFHHRVNEGLISCND